MSTTIQKNSNKKGISNTLFSPRKIEEDSLQKIRIATLQETLRRIDPCIGFASCIPPLSTDLTETRSTPFGPFNLKSPLSYHLNPIPFHINVVSNLEKLDNFQFSEEEFINVPMKIIAVDSEVTPSDWVLSSAEKHYLQSITVTEKSCRDLEYDTVERHNSKLWLYCQRRKILSTNAHKIFIRKNNFESLTPLFLPVDRQQPNTFFQESLKHQKNYEPIARDLY